MGSKVQRRWQVAISQHLWKECGKAGPVAQERVEGTDRGRLLRDEKKLCTRLGEMSWTKLHFGGSM